MSKFRLMFELKKNSSKLSCIYAYNYRTVIPFCLRYFSRMEIGKYILEYHANQFTENASLEELDFIHDGHYK